MYRWHPKFSTFKYMIFENGVYSGLNPKDCDFIVVRGGDGTMLLAVYALAKYHKPFCGVNLGHLGFLLNSPNEFSLEKLRGEDYELFSAPLLEATILTEDGRKVRELALNDIIIREDSGQSALLEVRINGVLLDAGMFGDGLIISTPLGSTAYTTNAGGVPAIPTLPIFELTPVAPRPRNRIQLVVPETSIISVKALELPKRKVKVNQGSVFQHHNVAEVEVRLATERAELVFFKPPEMSWDDFFLERFCEKVYQA